MDDRATTGLRIIGEVFGADYLARRAETETPFNRPFRQFSEEQCFGDLWNRPGLERKTRSLLLIATLTALNRVSELRLHVRSAINNGCTVEEIREVLYQSIFYCGLPAALGGFKAAEEVLTEMGALQPTS